MSKRIAIAMGIFLLISLPVTAQQVGYYYHYTLDTLGGVHGIAVDPDGKIWYASYDDSSGIQVRNSDGSPASFAPIYEVTVGGETYNTGMGCRGMNVDPDGNIVVVMNNTQIFKLDYQDGSCLAVNDLGESLTKPAVDENGNVYVGCVVGNTGPVWILDSSLDSTGTVADSLLVWSRGMAVTPDGKDLYVGSLWQRVVQHYQSEDGFFWELLDSIPGPAIDGGFVNNPSSPDFDPEGRLWINDEGDKAYYVYDMETMEYEKMEGEESVPFDVPRGVAFNSDASKAYIVDFGTGYIQMWSTTEPVGIKPGQINAKPRNFSLSQNYPNPFNSSTTIEFQVQKEGLATLKVFDVLGQEVAVLVDNYFNADTYRIPFRADDRFSSGIYLYQLQMHDQVITRRMLYIK